MQQQQQQPRLSRGPSLQDILDPTKLENIIIDMSDESLNAFLPHLPPQHSTKQDIINLVCF